MQNLDPLTRTLIALFEGLAPVALWTLVFLGVIALSLIIERAIFFSRRSPPKEQIVKNMHAFLQQGRISDGVIFFGQQGHWLSRLSRECFRFLEENPNLSPKNSIDIIRHHVENEIQNQVTRLERFTSFLATIGSITPYIGLFGTVLGVLEAFGALQITDAGFDQGELMVSIAHALVATAVGLAVAVPAVFAFNIFRRKIESATNAMESLNLSFIELINGLEQIHPKEKSKS